MYLNQRGGFYLIAGLSALLVAAGLIFILKDYALFPGSEKMQKNKPLKSEAPAIISETSPQPSPIAPSDNSYGYNNPQLVPYEEQTSPDGKYVFTLETPQDQSGYCSYTVKETASGKIMKLESLGGQIPCSEGMSTTSAFLALGDNGKLAVSLEPGKAAIVNIQTNSLTVYTYNPGMSYSGVTRDFQKWLLRKEGQGSSTFSLRDSNNAELLELSVSSDDQNAYALFRVFNDTENNGFVFVSRNYKPPKEGSGDSRVSYKFDFLSAGDLSFKTLLVTDYKSVVGRGCGGDSLIPQNGEIVIQPSCIVVNDKYVSSDGLIHIKF